MGAHLIGGLLTPFPPVRAGLAGLRKLPRAGGLQFVRDLLTPVTDLGRNRFRGDGPAARCSPATPGTPTSPWTPPGSGLMALLMSMLGQTVGLPGPRGRSRHAHPGPRPAAALPRRRDPVLHGGRAHRHLRRPRAHRAHPDGETLVARKAVVATRRRTQPVRRPAGPGRRPRPGPPGHAPFQLDPSTIKVDWALSGAVPWQSTPAKAPGTLHIADGVADMVEALGQVSAGLIPARPFMLAGQMTTTDPTRSPAGHRVHVGLHPRPAASPAATPATRASAATGTTTTSSASPTGCRPGSRSSRPGFGSRILERRILGPVELESRDANLDRRRHQRRHLPAAPGAGLPSGARAGPRRDRRTRPLPRLGLGPPRRRGARSRRHERRTRRAGPRPLATRDADAADDGLRRLDLRAPGDAPARARGPSCGSPPPGCCSSRATDTLSRVFHELKWALSRGRAAVRRDRSPRPPSSAA